MKEGESTMKSSVYIFMAFIALNIAFAMSAKQASAQEGAVSFQLFYDELSPYGQWVDYPAYGYVWIPNAGPDFVPYSTGGYWVLSNDGWTWVSDYSWGWAPFHYGRWDYDNAYGWFWVPDNVWGPSWVTWRQGSGYYGWAPMRPGVSIDATFGGSYSMPGDRWTFVRNRDFGRRHVDRYRINQRNNVTIFRNSTVITRTYVGSNRHARYVVGPDRNAVQKATGRYIKPVAIQNTNKPGEALARGQLRMYRPEVRSGNDYKQRPMPPRVVSMKDVKSPAQRPVLTRPRSVIAPVNNGGKQQPSQPRNGSPALNEGPQRQVAKPAGIDRGRPQPLLPQKASPAVNEGPQRQVAKPAGIDRGRPQPLLPQKASPAVNKVPQGQAAKPAGFNRGRPQPLRLQKASPAVIKGPQQQAVKPASVIRGGQQTPQLQKANAPVNNESGKQKPAVKPPHKNDNNKNQQTPPSPNQNEKRSG